MQKSCLFDSRRHFWQRASSAREKKQLQEYDRLLRHAVTSVHNYSIISGKNRRVTIVFITLVLAHSAGTHDASVHAN